MYPPKKTFVKQHKIKVKYVRIFCFLSAAFCVAGPFLLTRITLSANGAIFPKKSAVQGAPENTPTFQVPPQTQVSRIKIVIGETKEIPVAAVAINSVTVVSPEIAAAKVKNGNTLTITGLKIGETILIVSDSQKRLTFIIEVSGKRSVPAGQSDVSRKGLGNENTKMSGTYTVGYVQGFNGSPSLLRNNIDIQRKLSKDRTLRISGEIFNLFGGGDRNQAFAQVQNFGLNRFSVGVDSPGKTIDFLDSQIKISSGSLDNFSMRGFHLTKTSKSLSYSDTPAKGLEIFAGLARPSFGFYDNEQGKVAGAMFQIAGGKAWQIRAGFIMVSPQKNSRIGRGGTVLQFTGAYIPNKKFSAEGEVAYGNGGVSWRARLDVKLRKYGAFGEITRFDKDSPLAGIGAQGGRKNEALALYWRPDSRFSITANYNHTEVSRLVNSRLADFNRSMFSANANYRIGQNSRLFLRYLEQEIETAVPGGSSKFQIGTRSITLGHNIRFNQNWTNIVEAGINFSREASADAELENGFNLKEQLRFSWNRNSITGFFNYTYKTPSLISLIVRNPQILPPLLHAAFIADPAQFFELYRDRLASLLEGIELPLTRRIDAGFRFQTTISRFTLTGETRYNAGEIFSQNQKNLLISLGLNVRLDEANSLRVNGWNAFGSNSRSAITFSFTHRFGAGSGEGFQFSKLFGFDKARVQGRVYYDLNSNGQDDKGEPGIAGIKVQLSEKRIVTTDINGRYQFSANEGAYNITLISNDLGVRLRATTATQQKISLYSGQSLNVSFGMSDFGFISGRVFNDLNLTGEAPNSQIYGVSGVKVILRSGNIRVERTTSADGAYEFQNLSPGNYTIEIDPATLPANFRLPSQTSREIKVEPLQGFYFDIPIAAQRAIAGFVFVDKDRDGQFDPQKDEVVEGAYITANEGVAISDINGAYIIRNLAAGKVKLLARSPQGTENRPIFLELDAEPVTKRVVNIAVQK
jgi:hypothetical protein